MFSLGPTFAWILVIVFIVVFLVFLVGGRARVALILFFLVAFSFFIVVGTVRVRVRDGLARRLLALRGNIVKNVQRGNALELLTLFRREAGRVFSSQLRGLCKYV